MSKDEILCQLHDRGYTIDIMTVNNSQIVTFMGKYSQTPYVVKHCYSTEYTRDEIARDCAYDLLNWAGYKVVETLELKNV